MPISKAQQSVLKAQAKIDAALHAEAEKNAHALAQARIDALKARRVEGR